MSAQTEAATSAAGKPAGPAPKIAYDKIFQIGFNKCATRAISRFFHRHNLTTADWAKGELAQDIVRCAERHGGTDNASCLILVLE